MKTWQSTSAPQSPNFHAFFTRESTLESFGSLFNHRDNGAVPTHQKMRIGRMMSWTIFNFFPDAQWGMVYLLYIWIVLGVNVGKSTSPIEHLGLAISSFKKMLTDTESYGRTFVGVQNCSPADWKRFFFLSQDNQNSLTRASRTTMLSLAEGKGWKKGKKQDMLNLDGLSNISTYKNYSP